MKERQFSAQFRKELKKYCDNSGRNIHINLIVDAPRSNKKPYDAYFVENGRFSCGRFVALEFKVVNGPTLSGNILKPHQKDKLQEVANAGGTAYVVVLAQRFRKVFMLEIESWIDLFNRDDRYSFGDLEEELSESNVICERKKYQWGTCWNFEELFD